MLKRAYVTQANLRRREASHPLSLAAFERFFRDYTTRPWANRQYVSAHYWLSARLQGRSGHAERPQLRGEEHGSASEESRVDRQQTVDANMMTIFVARYQLTPWSKSR